MKIMETARVCEELCHLLKPEEEEEEEEDMDRV